jgi:hypothetical protein
MDEYICDECGEHFEDAFELVDHNTPEDEDEFNPSLILPNGYRCTKTRMTQNKSER